MTAKCRSCFYGHVQNWQCVGASGRIQACSGANMFGHTERIRCGVDERQYRYYIVILLSC